MTCRLLLILYRWCSETPPSFVHFREDTVTTDIYTLSPTRRSSDLYEWRDARSRSISSPSSICCLTNTIAPMTIMQWYSDRKSTRLNSSHGSISYAVFCLKKKRRPVSRIAERAAFVSQYLQAGSAAI